MSTSPFPIYVIHWRAPEQCLRTVRSLLASRSVDVRVHVIDNSPGLFGPAADELVDLGVTVIETDANVGFAGGANRALTHALAHHPDARWCAIVAHDVLVADDCVKALVDHVAGDPTVAVAGPRFGDGGLVLGGTWNGRRGRWRKEPWPDARPALEVDWLLGALLVLDTDWVRANGGLDARLGSYVEDVDLCLRVAATGRRVVCVRDAHAAETGRSSGDVTRTVDRNTMFVAYKQAGPRGLAGAAGVTLWLAAKTAAASVSPLRDPDRRRLSRQRTRAHLDALRDVVARRAQLTEFREVPDVVANPITVADETSAP